MRRLSCLVLALALLLGCAHAEVDAATLDSCRAEKGFSARNPGTTQLGVMVHDIDTWRAGATDRPTEFYLNIQPPAQLIGESHLDIIEAVKKWDILSTGLRVYAQGETSELVISDRGVKGVRSFDLLRSAGADYDALIDRATAVLGYRPGDMSFAGKHSVRAVLEWKGDSIVLMDGASLERLDGILNACSPTSARIDGPFNAFLTLNYADGDSASIAMATDGTAALFYRGAFLRYEGEDALLGLFDLTSDAFHILTNGETADA